MSRSINNPDKAWFSSGIFINLFCLIKSIWRKGAVYRFNESVRKLYRQSFSKRIAGKFLSVENPVIFSFYARAMNRARECLYCCGRVIKKSFSYKIFSFFLKPFNWLSKYSDINLRKIFLFVFAFYLPIEYMLRDKLNLGIVSSVWEELFILAAIIFIIWQKMLNNTKAIVRETPLDPYIFLFVAVSFFLMMMVMPYPYIAISGFRATTEYIIWFFLVIRLISDDNEAKVLYFAILLMGAAICLHGVYQYIVGVTIPESWTSQSELGVRTRVFSITGSPNILGSLIVMIAPMMAALVYYLRSAFLKIVTLGLTFMMCLSLLFTFSRGAWVGMFAAVILFALIIDRRLIVLMLSLIALALVFIPSIATRLTYLFTADYAEASAIGGRALRWELGKIMLTESNPWFGYGLGRFGGAVAMNNKILDETEDFEYFYMDNYYLKTMVEMGYIGVFFFVLMLLALFVWGLRMVYRSGATNVMADEGRDPLIKYIDDIKAPAAGILSGLTGVMVHCYFENIFEEPYMMALFWGLAALLFYIGLFSKRVLRRDEAPSLSTVKPASSKAR